MANPRDNMLLRKLTDDDWDAFRPFLREVELEKGQVLLQPGSEIEFVYSPMNCTCSVLAGGKNDTPIEVGMFGRDGMSNFVVREGDIAYLRTQVFFSGTACRVPAADFARAIARLPSLNEVTLRFKDFAAVQFAYTSLANGSDSIEARLARWLLMAFDRMPEGGLPIIHNLIAGLLSVRRSGVTNAFHILEGVGAIKNTRGMVELRDRAKLEAIAGSSYGPAEAAYASLMTYDPYQRRTAHV